ncbi:MAG TPA: ATP-binding protein, partial [Anaeromyxobacteraceae bacterium]|nr:ATP-binding protein [Anaeromyxobacteraceae bacterium]
RKQAEGTLGQTQAALAHATRITTLGVLTASIAHEVNQPLAAMVTNTNACVCWLAHHPPNLEEARQTLERILADGHRAGEVLGRIRGLVRNAPPKKTWMDINETIGEVLALARGEAQRRGVALAAPLAPALPRIWGDRVQVQQVLLNLLLNGVEAVQEVREGPREVQVSSESDGASGVRVAVRDSGPGLDASSLDRLFDAFYTTKPEGLGMGLAISRSIIEAHGGRLWAEANVPRGAVFQFTLPAEGEKVA